ncbi:hypothetical protein EMCRGX_G021807 [Ephydatia muelleri]
MDAGAWKAQQSFSRLAACLAIQMGCSKSQATTIVYQRLSLSLVRANARALLSRARFRQSEEGVEKKKRAKRRAKYLEVRDDVLESARASYEADPEKKRTAERERYHADPEKKRSAKRESYQAEPEKKQTAERERYQADPEKKQTAERERYQADPEKKQTANESGAADQKRNRP